MQYVHVHAHVPLREGTKTFFQREMVLPLGPQRRVRFHLLTHPLHTHLPLLHRHSNVVTWLQFSGCGSIANDTPTTARAIETPRTVATLKEEEEEKRERERMSMREGPKTR